MPLRPGLQQRGCPLRLRTLLIGLAAKWYAIREHAGLVRIGKQLNLINQLFILALVWMAVSQSRTTILNSGQMAGIILVLSFVYHALLLGAAFWGVRLFGFARGRMESVVFMGGQKTLTLSIVLQVSIFPQYGLALAVCVIHHVIHLLMDGYVAERLKDQRI